MHPSVQRSIIGGFSLVTLLRNRLRVVAHATAAREKYVVGTMTGNLLLNQGISRKMLKYIKLSFKKWNFLTVLLEVFFFWSF